MKPIDKNHRPEINSKWEKYICFSCRNHQIKKLFSIRENLKVFESPKAIDLRETSTNVLPVHSVCIDRHTG